MTTIAATVEPFHHVMGYPPRPIARQERNCEH
jgi:hypothetical protein